ncbi:eight-cysteine-cluster domain-containing protein [Candidatus Woesearchaeota archaeon]|nr:eight-cysteine-cluster domain-containing protein [Candidatus Woesearchaeota archaeon]
MRLTTTTTAAIIILAVLLIAACTPQQQPPSPLQPPQTTAECSSNSGCGVGGCSGQVCTTKGKASGLITTCEYKAEYACLNLTSCGCVEGKCQWAGTAELEKCLQQSKDKETVY